MNVFIRLRQMCRRMFTSKLASGKAAGVEICRDLQNQSLKTNSSKYLRGDSVLRIITLIVAIGFFLPLPVAARVLPCGMDSLPLGARNLVSERFKSWKILEISDLSVDDQKLWVSDHRNLCPVVLS